MTTDEKTIRNLMTDGENETLEFKLRLHYERHENQVNRSPQKAVIKGIVRIPEWEGRHTLDRC